MFKAEQLIKDSKSNVLNVWMWNFLVYSGEVWPLQVIHQVMQYNVSLLYHAAIYNISNLLTIEANNDICMLHYHFFIIILNNESSLHTANINTKMNFQWQELCAFSQIKNANWEQLKFILKPVLLAKHWFKILITNLNAE